ncbi:MAG: carboxylating nicotinate-nucleotide diphosphorylase [Phycisphaerales bacterium]|nr:carboxylating nicotinate-nucleotide diphosphorylase [Phycisphaerales bacterium]MCI0629864.1 carboxylating nicotinate-nucleotide diphosphorylase [Phycisphaerales bacterium]MCI0675758.1 carboxylating nicotinate-nucleotide diphosphorylase [Phycisphaerales bacterium]
MLDPNTLALADLLEELVGSARIDSLLASAFEEDVPFQLHDVTTNSVIDREAFGEADFIARQAGVVAGLPIVSQYLENPEFDGALVWSVEDGRQLKAGQRLGKIACDMRTILLIERPFLNVIGWLSGIATLTRRYVDAVSGTNAVICDTRKTTPGLRVFEKYAVRCGGGTLHRLGLFDAALYKDNHLAGIAPDQLAASLTNAVGEVRGKSELRFVEVEVDTLEQLRHVLTIKDGLIDIVLLDNMLVEELQEAVSLRNEIAPEILLEASGGITLANVKSIAKTGVDRISVGAITHSAPWLDVGLDFKS